MWLRNGLVVLLAVSMGGEAPGDQKSSAEEGPGINHLACHRGDRATCGDSIHRVLFMGNDNKCDYGSEVVKQFAANTFLVTSQTDTKTYGSGILLPDCKTFLTLSHIFLAGNGLPKDHPIVLRNPNIGTRFTLVS